jgi:hypothetical protein
MINKIAKINSYIFHPIFIPTYLFYFILFHVPYISMLIPLNLKLILLAMIFTSTSIMPLILIAIFYKFKLLDSFFMDKREERILPLVTVSISYYITYYLLKQMNLPEIISLIMLIACFIVILTLLINYKWKISIHSLSWGGITGIIIGLSVYYMLNNILIIMLLFLISGLVASSRLILQAHSSKEIYLGYLLGFLSVLLIIH